MKPMGSPVQRPIPSRFRFLNPVFDPLSLQALGGLWNLAQHLQWPFSKANRGSGHRVVSWVVRFYVKWGDLHVSPLSSV